MGSGITVERLGNVMGTPIYILFTVLHSADEVRGTRFSWVFVSVEVL